MPAQIPGDEKLSLVRASLPLVRKVIFLAVFFRTMCDELSERGTTRSLNLPFF